MKTYTAKLDNGYTCIVSQGKTNKLSLIDNDNNKIATHEDVTDKKTTELIQLYSTIRVDKGYHLRHGWVTGFSCFESGHWYISTNSNTYLILPNTLCIGTGYSINGVNLFEYDILKFTSHEGFFLEDCEIMIQYSVCDFGFMYHKMFNGKPAVIGYALARHDEPIEDIFNHCTLIGNYKDELLRHA